MKVIFHTNRKKVVFVLIVFYVFTLSINFPLISINSIQYNCCCLQNNLNINQINYCSIIFVQEYRGLNEICALGNLEKFIHFLRKIKIYSFYQHLLNHFVKIDR